MKLIPLILMALLFSQPSFSEEINTCEYVSADDHEQTEVLENEQQCLSWCNQLSQKNLEKEQGEICYWNGDALFSRNMEGMDFDE